MNSQWTLPYINACEERSPWFVVTSHLWRGCIEQGSNHKGKDCFLPPTFKCIHNSFEIKRSTLPFDVCDRRTKQKTNQINIGLMQPHCLLNFFFCLLFLLIKLGTWQKESKNPYSLNKAKENLVNKMIWKEINNNKQYQTPNGEITITPACRLMEFVLRTESKPKNTINNNKKYIKVFSNIDWCCSGGKRKYDLIKRESGHLTRRCVLMLERDRGPTSSITSTNTSSTTSSTSSSTSSTPSPGFSLWVI